MSVSSSKARGFDVLLVLPLLRLASAETSPTWAAFVTRREQACVGSALVRQQHIGTKHIWRPHERYNNSMGAFCGHIPCQQSLDCCGACGHAAAWADSQRAGRGPQARLCTEENQRAS